MNTQSVPPPGSTELPTEYFSHNSDWALGGKGIFIVPNIILQKCHKLEFPRRYFLKPHHSQPNIWKKTILKIINVLRLQIYKLIQSLYSVTCLTIKFCQDIIFILLYQNQIFLTGQTLNHCHQQLYMLSHVVLNAWEPRLLLRVNPTTLFHIQLQMEWDV